ncbi:MAG: N-acetyltransferase family protein [Kofleriaceae bacterium]
MGADRVTTIARALPQRNADDVTLRRADLTDRERVFEYNYADDVRAVSGSKDVIAYSDHVRWFGKRIAQPASPIWIIEQYGEPVGTVRIDARVDANAKISIALAPAARGHGIGRKAIELACTRWCGTVIAEIHESNAQSRACFVACGFAKTGKREAFDVYLWSP